jgi:hypothetical protein
LKVWILVGLEDLSKESLRNRHLHTDAPPRSPRSAHLGDG